MTMTNSEIRSKLRRLLEYIGLDPKTSGGWRTFVTDPAVEEISAMIQEEINKKNQAYYERNQLVAALSKIYPAWLGVHPKDEEWEDDWRTIVYIKIPVKTESASIPGLGKRLVTKDVQVSWHIHDSDKQFFKHLDYGSEEWDGHTNEEKYKRLLWIEKPTP